MSKKPSGTKSKAESVTLELPGEKVLSELEKVKEVKEVPKINFASLKKRIRDGEAFVAVTNDSNQPFIRDWDLDLLPVDLEDEFNKYLQEKYVQYEKSDIIGDIRIVTIYEDGKSINFLESFLSGKKFPVLLPRPVGKEMELRSSFVLNADSAVILTQKQADSLSQFEKVKRSWTSQGKKLDSDWLGFLKMKTITKEEDLYKYDLCFVTSQEVIDTHEEVRKGQVLHTRRQSGIIREED